ncbi:TlpA family protein disulfide reductase [Salipaludibacillus sp. LMS25]|uniref:TlpA disulfide reductase family protein n=1 Tax=Salipaludibacillus sp. LMS25 TaxID=2924031 RepID=UPI0020D0201B|nr:TlpA disulfide reductase family protein [Salipaludibacillus sp. LMS25]UTR15358.1 TlpA family protein disulfide reductase [Salipaludibacillus sp. LMS25]
MKHLHLIILCFLLFIGGVFFLQSTNDRVLVEKAMSQKEVAEVQNSEGIYKKLSLDTLEGSEYSLEGLAGKRTFLFFFTSWCHVCEDQWQQVLEAKATQQDSSLEFIAINLTKEEFREDDVGNYLSQYTKENMMILLDKEGEAQREFDVKGIPTSFIIGEEGTIIHRQDGLIMAEEIVKKMTK